MDFAKVGFTDIDGVLRAKLLHQSKRQKQKDIGFCNVVFGWDLHDKLFKNKSGLSDWADGYADALFSIDAATTRTVDNKAFYLGDFHKDPTFNKVCPRSILKTILAAYEAKGWVVKVGYEYEWFMFDDESQSPITDGMFGYSALRLSQSDGWISDLLHDLQEAQIELEGLHTETGPGVFEAAIKYKDALEAADDAILFKHIVKTTAHKHHYMASFMAKWNANLPGCGGHFHIHVEKNDRNIFSTEQSPTLDAYIAGIVQTMLEAQVLYHPFINSYKRSISASWAPTTASWGKENRTTAIRLIENKDRTARIEMRVAGADANPYIALAATLAAGLYGIESDLQKSDMVSGNAYEQHLPVLSTDLNTATARFEHSSVMARFFSERFQTHYASSRRHECSEYQKAVTDWEIRRYLEIV